MSNNDFVWTDEMVKEFVIFYNMKPGFVTGVDPIMEGVNQFKKHKKIINKEWDIISFRKGAKEWNKIGNTDGLFRTKIVDESDIYSRRESEFFDTLKGYAIHSVCRLLDNETFTIGDVIGVNWYKFNPIFCINRFVITEDGFFVEYAHVSDHSNRGMWKFGDICKLSEGKPLFSVSEIKEILDYEKIHCGACPPHSLDRVYMEIIKKAKEKTGNEGI